MLKKDIKMVMGLGIGCFLIASIGLRFLLSLMFDMGAFPWARSVGAVILIIGFVEFIYERWHGFAFFTGKSQHGGSNANSFFVMAVALAICNLSWPAFITILVIMAIVLLALGFGLNRIREQRGLE